MILLGLDPRPASTLALFVDAQGRVLSRSTFESIDEALAAKHRGRKANAVGLIDGNGAYGRGVTAVDRAVAIALAESWSGAARGARHVVALTLDASVHVGIVVDGRPFSGAHGLAGAVGWLSLNPVERVDYRTHGCLEAEVGAAGIVRRMIWRIKAGDRSAVEQMAGGDLNAITTEQIFAAARSGDGVAISIVRDTVRYIGMAMANLVTILDPESVVLGGVIAEAADLLLEPATAEMNRRLLPAANGRVSVVAAAHGDDAAAIGAARAALLAAQPK